MAPMTDKLSPLSEAPPSPGGILRAPDPGKRQHRLVVVLGAPGSGKTSLVDRWIADADERGRDVRILDPARQWPKRGAWPDGGRDDERGPEERAEAFLRALKRERWGKAEPDPMLLVLDDADNYLGGQQPRGIWRDLFTTFRHWKADVLISARRSQDLPKVCFTSASHVVLFAHREVYSRDYLTRYVGADVVARLPREPYRFLLVDVASGDAREGTTKARE